MNGSGAEEGPGAPADQDVTARRREAGPGSGLEDGDLLVGVFREKPRLTAANAAPAGTASSPVDRTAPDLGAHAAHDLLATAPGTAVPTSSIPALPTAVSVAASVSPTRFHPPRGGEMPAQVTVLTSVGSGHGDQRAHSTRARGSPDRAGSGPARRRRTPPGRSARRCAARARSGSRRAAQRDRGRRVDREHPRGGDHAHGAALHPARAAEVDRQIVEGRRVDEGEGSAHQSL